MNTCADHDTAIDEAMLRKRIQELQHYRRMGLTTPADIDKFDADSIRRVRHTATSFRILTCVVGSRESKHISRLLFFGTSGAASC